MALGEKQVAELVAIAGADAVHADTVALLAYGRDASVERGRPDAVVLPQSAEQTAALVRWTAGQGLPVVGWGAGTGQTGGAIAHRGGLILAFRNMRRILDLDAEGGQVLTEPGIITSHLDRAVRECGLLYPPDPASDRASSIGGNLAENAGGPRCCKYGVTAHYVLGLDAVLPGGERVTFGGAAADIPEPNFLDVLVGSEGTLALVTAARLRLVRRAEAAGTLMASFASPEAAAQAVTAIIRRGLRPAALEMLDRLLCECVMRSGAMTLAPGAGALLIAEVEGYGESLPGKLAQMEEAVRAFAPLDVRLAASEAEREAIWYARKSAFAATAWIAPDDVSMDVVVPRSHLPAAFRDISEMGAAAGFQVGYVAHAGDGNIHPEIFCDLHAAGALERVHALQNDIVRYVIALGGSFTGEHGVGLEKRRHMAEMYGPDELAAMRDVKAVFDPADRMNPGKIFPEPAPIPSAPPVAPRELAPALRPASVAELREMLAGLQAARQPAWIGGSGSKCAPPAGAALARISTAGLAAIRERAYDDLYITVDAGATVAGVAAAARADGFLFPLAAPWPGATVGGTIAGAFNAPWRGLVGGIREALLAAEVALPDGRLLRLGRPLVKDVAGYSLSKLFIGSYGALGALTAVSLRVSPLPQEARTWCVPCENLRTALAAARIFRQEAESLAALLLDTRAGVDAAPFRVVCEYAGTAEDVAIAEARSRRGLAQARLPAAERVDGDALDLWSAAVRGEAANGQMVMRAGVPPVKLPALLEVAAAAAPAGGMIDLANALAYFSAPSPTGERPAWEDGLRAAAEEAGGYALALGRGVYPPRGLRGAPETRRVLAELKRRWDPAGILNNEV